MGCLRLTYQETFTPLNVVYNDLNASDKCFLGDYRYGFQGSEKDDEMKGQGNSLDFGARIYDPRVGRWLSLDAYESKYPDLSAYCYVANNPIIYTDPTGNVIVYGNDDKSQKAKAAIQKLRSESAVFNAVYEQMDKSPLIIKIEVNDERIDKVAKKSGLDPKLVGGFLSSSQNIITLRQSSSDHAYAEEIFHAFQINNIYGGDGYKVPALEAEAKLFDEVVLEQKRQSNKDESNKPSGPYIEVSQVDYFAEKEKLFYLDENIENATEVTNNEDYSNYTKGFSDFYEQYDNHPYKGEINQSLPEAYNYIIKEVNEKDNLNNGNSTK